MTGLRTLPANRPIERLVLGLMLLDAAVLADLRQVIGPEHFTTDRDRRILRCMYALFDAGQPVEPFTVATKMFEAGDAGPADGLISYLVDLDQAGVLHF